MVSTLLVPWFPEVTCNSPSLKVKNTTNHEQRDQAGEQPMHSHQSMEEARMTTTDTHGRGPGDGTWEAPARPAVDRRRLLLSGAAGGLALAANGLILPGWLTDQAAADNHPVRGIQKRKANHRRKARNRKRRNHRQRSTRNNHGNGFAIIDGIRWGYYSEAGPFNVQFWGRTNAGRSWGILDQKQIPNESFVELRTTDVIGILWINDRYFLRAENFLGALHLTIGYGGTFTSNHGWENGTRILSDYSLAEGNLAPAMVVDGFEFTVERISDDSDFKKPSLTIRRV